MKLLIPITMNFLASLLTVLFCVTQAGCTPGTVGEAPKPKITFELPAEWQLSDTTPTSKGGYWDAYLFGPDRKAGYISSFTMVERPKTNDDIYPGANPKEKAEKYFQRMTAVCAPNWGNCTVEPIREVEHAGIKAYVISTDSDGGWGLDQWDTEFFFEKNGVILNIEIIGRFDTEITQKAYKRVFETLNISYQSLNKETKT